MSCVKSPFTLIVIPGLTKPAPYLIRGGNDSFGTNVKKCWTHHTRDDSHLVGLPDPARAGSTDKEFDSDPAHQKIEVAGIFSCHL